MHQKILILDFGSQYTQLIARRIRETNVYCELHPFDVNEQFIKDFSPKGIILSGGPASVMEDETPRAPQVVFELGIPVLGICYGMQTMATQLGGTVENAKVREFGYAQAQTSTGALLKDIQDDPRNVAQPIKIAKQRCIQDHSTALKESKMPTTAAMKMSVVFSKLLFLIQEEIAPVASTEAKRSLVHQR